MAVTCVMDHPLKEVSTMICGAKGKVTQVTLSSEPNESLHVHTMTLKMNVLKVLTKQQIFPLDQIQIICRPSNKHSMKNENAGE